MKSMIKTALLPILILVAACGGSPDTTTGGGINVVATTNIVADLVRTVGGPEVTVEALMGPGIDPHLYKASAGDVRRMSSAEAIFYSGIHLEGKMSEVLEKMGERGVRTVAVGECVPEENLISSAEFSGLHDPHVWFDVGLWSQSVGCVAEMLAALDPDHAGEYLQRATDYADELNALDAWIQERVQVLAPDQRILVTAHDAFGYFGRAYVSRYGVCWESAPRRRPALRMSRCWPSSSSSTRFRRSLSKLRCRPAMFRRCRRLSEHGDLRSKSAAAFTPTHSETPVPRRPHIPERFAKMSRRS